MSASDSVVLPAPLRRRSEIIGLCAGSLCFLFAFFGNSLGALFPSGPPAVVLPMVLFSALAGAAACFRAHSSPECPIGAAPRLGIQAGIFAAITGGALTVWAATLHAFGIGSFPTDASSLAGLLHVFPHAGAYLNLLLALLGVPPAIFFGVVGALITTMISARVAQGNAAATGQSRLFQFRDPIFSSMLALSTLGYLSPFTVALKPKPKPIAVAPLMPVRPLATPAPPPPPPKWRYTKAAGFDNADLNRVTVTDRRSFEIDANLPIVLSPDENRIAYFRRGSGTVLEVRELDTMDVLQSEGVGTNPTGLVWSSDGQRLLIVDQENAKSLRIFDTRSGRLVVLPQPVNERIPEGEPNWWDEEEVLFSQDGKLRDLNLAKLRVLPLDESVKWTALGKERQTRIATYKRPALPANFRWRFELIPRIGGYTVPLQTAADWPTNEGLFLSLADPDNAYRFALTSADIKFGDSILATSDASKFLRIRDGVATVFYFGIGNAPPTSLSLTMPSAPDATVSEAVAKKMVCAFICPPVINPLNGKTVGPDRRYVKALARIASWKGTEAEAWIEDAYFAVQPGDVIADLHTWANHHPHAAGELGNKEWFTVIDHVGHKPAPARVDAPLLDHRISVNVFPNGSAEKVDRVIYTSLPSPESAPRPQAESNVPPPPIPKTDWSHAVLSSTPVEQTIATFIAQHHQKSSRSDVNGLVADYADRVDHFDHGIVDREFIRRDELDYHSPGTHVTETIITAPAVTPIGNGIYSAAYSISFLRVRADHHWTRGISDIQLQIEMTPAGPRISSQKSQSHDLQKGR